MSRPIGYLLAVFALAAALVGCQSPNKANIELRKQNARLRQEVASLEASRQSDASAIQRLERNATTVPVLPHDRITRLFTTHGLKLGRLTGGGDLDRKKPGDEGLQVYLVPTDQDGDEIKAAGAFVVEAFDLATSGEVRLGRWEIPLEAASEKWLGNALQYGYIFELPWQSVPTHDEVTVRVTFTDELTGRNFTVQRAVKVALPQPPAPGSDPVTRR